MIDLDFWKKGTLRDGWSFDIPHHVRRSTLDEKEQQKRRKLNASQRKARKRNRK